MTEANELAACPFCGATEQVGLEWEDEPDFLFFVVCEPCGARTMGGRSEAEAIAAWNQRAKPDTTPDGVREALAERLMDDETLSLQIIDRAWQDAGLSGRPFFGEAVEPGAAIASIVRQVDPLAEEREPVRLSAVATIETTLGEATNTPEPMEFENLPDAIAALSEWVGSRFSPLKGKFTSLSVNITAIRRADHAE